MRLALTFLLALLALPGCSKSKNAPAVPPPPADLTLVPADAVGFAHINLVEVWRSDLLEEVRKTYDAAGPKAHAALEEKISPRPSTFDRITSFVVMKDGAPLVYGLLSFTQPLNTDALARQYLHNISTQTIADKKVYTSGGFGIALYFPSDRQVMISTEEGLKHYLQGSPASTGPMKAAIDLAATRPIVLSGNLEAMNIPWQMLKAPPELLPLLQAKTVTMSFELAGDPKVSLAASYADVAAAERGIEALKKMGKSYTATEKKEFEAKLFNPKNKTAQSAEEYMEVIMAAAGLGGMNALDEMIDNPGIQKEGSTLSWNQTIPKEVAKIGGVYAGVGFALLMPAVAKVQEAAERTQAADKVAPRRSPVTRK